MLTRQHGESGAKKNITSDNENKPTAQSAHDSQNEPKPVEVTPGNVHPLGLPFVIQNQSGFNFWDIKSGDYFIEMEGRYYGWDNSTVQVTSMGPGNGPPLHTHPIEELFALVEGECSFIIGTEMLHIKAPCVVRVPPHTPHSPTSLGSGRNVMVNFFPSNEPGGTLVDAPDPFAHIKVGGGQERAAMIENFKKILADFDADGDGRISKEEAPLMLRDSFERYDSDQDGFISLEDAQTWN